MLFQVGSGFEGLAKRGSHASRRSLTDELLFVPEASQAGHRQNLGSSLGGSGDGQDRKTTERNRQTISDIMDRTANNLVPTPQVASQKTLQNKTLVTPGFKCSPRSDPNSAKVTGVTLRNGTHIPAPPSSITLSSQLL